ncbi:MAG: 4-(cytidine 5'-diphospho)-2-C-methyl-D-erythritol kinase, partial [Candidatus Margulisbacteria bacterium]|nr:4-(cytidine 5'-diphospho)-2-C-methyl-D-erythritol kinase [Candidatus Margulisiibacteriota bacterium]
MSQPLTYRFNVYAKINLGLLVSRPRSNGYHPIQSIFQSVSLADTFHIACYPNSLEISLSCNNKSIPTNHQNLIIKVCEHYKSMIPFGLTIQLQKRIPVGGGLGGGSTNAAGILQFLNQSCGWGWSTQKLQQESLHFGTDIPFLIEGGTSLVTGIGDAIKPLKPIKPSYYLLINPQKKADTPKIYQKFDQLSQDTLSQQDNSWISTQTPGPNALKEAAFSIIPELGEIEN